MSTWTVPPRASLHGEVTLPGDKSLSHRALLLNALGQGEANITGLNPGADVRSSTEALRALGVRCSGAGNAVRLTGRSGRLRPAVDAIDCGNSGTTMRLLAGIVAAQPFTSTLDGDASLRARPMRRIAEPLRSMGARAEGPNHAETAPLILTGGDLRSIEWSMPVASAQVKSCLLLAAQTAGTGVTVTEPTRSRDHTERMLAAMGGDVQVEGNRVTLRSQPLRCVDVEVSGDPSAAALVSVPVCAIPKSQVTFPAMLMNATRAGFLNVLTRMGAKVEVTHERDRAGETVADVAVTAAPLHGVRVEADEIPSMIDEIPALAAIAAFARGTSVFHGVGELRVKESDRVAAILDLLGAFGVVATATEDRLEVIGGSPQRPRQVSPADDHRMAMVACGMALAADGGSCQVESCDVIAVSYPGFLPQLEALLS